MPRRIPGDLLSSADLHTNFLREVYDMKIEKRVNLYAFEVEYIDQREAKPAPSARKPWCWTVGACPRWNV